MESLPSAGLGAVEEEGGVAKGGREEGTGGGEGK